MFSFFEKIFSKITSAIISVVVSLGLISAPIQPQVEVKMESMPAIQDRVTDNQQNLQTESTSEKSKSIKPTKSVVSEPSPQQFTSIPSRTITPPPESVPTQVPPPQPSPIYIPVPVQQSPSISAPTPPAVAEPTPVVQPKPSLADIEIINPIAKKGIGPRIDPITGVDVGYRANNYKLNPDGTLAEGSVAPDDSNSISLGLITRNDDGLPILKYDVTIEATDPPDPNCWICRRFIKGTGTDQTGIGSITKIYKDGIPETVSYYPFLYEFKTAGQHTITFSANGMTESITLTVK